jgi:putative flippase GtrA
VSAIGLAVHLLVLYAAVDMLAIELMLSKVIATGSVFLWNFLARNYFVFRAPAGGNASAETDRR